MSAAVTEPIQIRRVPDLSDDHELSRAVHAASEHLQELVQKHRLEPAKRELDWGASNEAPFTHVVAILRERDRYGSRQANRTISRSRMLDPVSRGVLMSELLGDVLRQRWFQVDEVIEKGIKELEQEEQSHG
jgi:hypothetical protein